MTVTRREFDQAIHDRTWATAYREGILTGEMGPGFSGPALERAEERVRAAQATIDRFMVEGRGRARRAALRVVAS